MDTFSVRCSGFFLIGLVLALAVGPAVDSARANSFRESLSGDLDLRAYYNDVSGNETNSFLTQGPGFLSDLYFYYDDTSRDTSQIQWDGLLYLQSTDDPRFTIRGDKVRLRNAYLTAERPEHWKGTGGYFSENFSPFTFNSSLLGLNTQYHPTDSTRIKVFGGRASRARPGESFGRFAEGARLEWSPAEENTLSLNYVRTHDEAGSLDGGELAGVNSDTATNVVRSIEYDGNLNEDLSVRGEYALSDFDSEPVSGPSSVENEGAAQLSVRWQPRRRSRLTGYYERVTPDFTTLSGFARTDRELSRLNWSERFSQSLSLMTEYEVWHDGLESTTTNDVTNWSVETNYTPTSRGWWQRRATLFFESRENEGETEGINFTDDSNDEDQYRWGADLSNQFGALGLDLSYSRERYSSDSETIRVLDTTLNRRFELAIPVTYTLNGLYKQSVNDLGGGANPAVDRTVRIANEIYLAEGRAQELHLYHRYLNEDVDGTPELVDHTIGSEYRHILNRKTNSRLTFALELQEHTDKGDPTQDYQEETIELRYQTPF